jgi:hypothetical protein
MTMETDPNGGSNGGSHSGVVRAAVAAAATGAAAYGVRRLRASHDEEDAGDDRADETEETSDGAEGGNARGTLSAKREELTHALSTKVADAKNAASKLKPSGGSRRSMLDGVREAASDQLLPIAREAASSLGATVAKKAPDMVRDELMPRFIEGFQKTAR